MNLPLKVFVLALLCVLTVGLLGSVAAALPVRLSELVSSNRGSFRDEEGDAPDWIEIQNTGTASVDLAGCGLSDRADQPFKWLFPTRNLPAGGLLVVFASGKNRITGSFLHANFSINTDGEEILLTAADGAALDRVSVPALRPEMSYGRAASSGGGWRFFPKATPRATNTGLSFAEVLAKAPAFSTAGGFYPDPVSLTLFPAEPGTVIRYTLDGSEPTEASLAFDLPLPIVSRTGQPNVLSMIGGTSTANQHTDGWKPPVGEVRKATVVRARAFKPDALASPVATHTYFIGSAALHTDGLPVVSIATDQKGFFDYTQGIYMLGKVFADYVAAHPGEALTGHTPANYTQRGSAWERAADLEFFDHAGSRAFATPAVIDIKGQSSRSFRQKSFGLSVAPSAASDSLLSYPLFPGLTKLGDGSPLESFQHVRLRNCGNDWAYASMRDGFCHQLAQGLGLPVMSWRPVSIYLDGEYWGVLEMREEQNPDYFEAHYGIDPADLVILYGTGTVENGAAGDGQSFLALRTFADTHDLSVPEHYAHVAARLDVEDFLLYQVVEIYFGNADWPQNNMRVWRQRRPEVFPDRDLVPPGQDGRWRWMLFDVDLSCGHPWAGSYTENTLSYALSPVGRPGTNSPWATVFLRALLKNPEVKRTFASIAADLLNSHLKETRAITLVEAMKAALQPAMAEHIRRWQSNGNSVTTWSNNYVATLRTYASQRAINVRQHFTAQLGLGGYAPLTVEVEPAAGGLVRVNNRLLINSALAGVGSPAYPWRGTYFRNVPVSLEALPLPGYAFDGWTTPSGPAAVSLLSLTLAGPTTVTARFVPTTSVPGSFDSWQRLGDGSFRLGFHGSSNEAWELQFSSDLVTWRSLHSFITDATGRHELTLPSATPGAAAGFYRVVAP